MMNVTMKHGVAVIELFEISHPDMHVASDTLSQNTYSLDIDKITKALQKCSINF